MTNAMGLSRAMHVSRPFVSDEYSTVLFVLIVFLWLSLESI